jgi:hypothetical protein
VFWVLAAKAGLDKKIVEAMSGIANKFVIVDCFVIYLCLILDEFLIEK